MITRRYIFPMMTGLMMIFSASVAAVPLTTTLVPQSYTTITGSDNNAQIEVLQVQQCSGMALTAGAFVQFQAQSAGSPYFGYRSFYLPADITVGSITALQVKTNYHGPSKSAQAWTWQIYDWKHDGWVPVGNNSKAFNNGPWTVFKWNIGGPYQNYVHPDTRELRVSLRSDNIVDDVEIDYEALLVTSDSDILRQTKEYYVSKNGNDSNPGTLDLPWKTISKAALACQAGSTVYIRAGVYNERLVVANSGTLEAGPITFMSYPGEPAVIDGTGVKIPSSSGAAPRGLVEIVNKNYIVIQGLEIRNVNLQSSSLFPAGISIWGACDHIELRNNFVHHIANSSNGAHGIAVYGTQVPLGVTNLIIDGNEASFLKLGQSESLVLNGNVSKWSVTNNIIHDNDNIGIDAIGFEGTASNTQYDQAREGSILDNLIYNISNNSNPAYPKNDNSADGIYVDGGKQILINGNIVHHCNIGIELASEHKGRTTSLVTARNNLVFLNTGPGFSIGGYSSNVGSTDHCSIVNNTLFGNDTMKTYSGEFQIQYFPTSGVSNNIFFNNVVYTNDQSLFISNPFKYPVVQLDYNIYFTPSKTNQPVWNWKTSDKIGFAKYKSGSGNDAHSFYADPQFIDPVSPILYLAAASPANNTGLNLGESYVGNEDIAGQQRVQGGYIDMGAYAQ